MVTKSAISPQQKLLSKHVFVELQYITKQRTEASFILKINCQLDQSFKSQVKDLDQNGILKCHLTHHP